MSAPTDPQTRDVRDSLAAAVLVATDGYRPPAIVTAKLAWSEVDPLVVVVDLAGHTWVWSRDLLAEGADIPVGEADVMVLPISDRHLEVVLSTPDGIAAIRFSSPAIRAFLARTEAIVPRGLESYWDEDQVRSWA